MNTPNLHPDYEQLQAFANGQGSAAVNVTVSAHVAMCNECRLLIDELTESLAESLLDSEGQAVETQYHSLINYITNQPQDDSAHRHQVLPELTIGDITVQLPRVLATLVSGPANWKNLTSGIREMRVPLDRGHQSNFMYMTPGSQAPRHTHRGTEITLVLTGTFHDELGHYRPGDYIVRCSDIDHAPTSEEGCLCFAVLDKPLTFTHGIARLLNPVQRLMFNR